LGGELAAFAAESGLTITVCHLPPGTSKWNKIEHRLFSHISMNWRGRPLQSNQTVVQLIAATTTRTGLAVRAELDNANYPAGIKITDQQMAALPLQRHEFHGYWNYTLRPNNVHVLMRKRQAIAAELSLVGTLLISVARRSTSHFQQWALGSDNRVQRRL
jgi:hypothetical protein